MQRQALLAAFILAGCSGTGVGAGATTPPAAIVTPAPATVVTPAPTQDPVSSAIASAVALSGVIEFGTAWDQDTLTITKAASSFKTTTKKIAYVMRLSEAAGATSLTISLTRRSSGGSETTIVSLSLSVANPDFDILGNSADLATIAGNKAGTYVMRVIREGKTLAEGTFTLVK